jgi:alpha-glucosidase
MPWQSSAPHAGFSTAVPWLPVSPEHLALAVDRQQHDADSLLALTRGLIDLRRRNAALRNGSLRFIDAPADVLAFERNSAESHVLCAFNLGLSERHWRPETKREWRPIASVGGAKDSDGAKEPGGAAEWSFPPLSGLIARCPF